jgi:hypothetical protein
MLQYFIATALIALASISASRAEEKQVTIPAGTSMMVKLDKDMSFSNKPGTKFSGVLQGDLGTNGAVKTGSAIIGEVTRPRKKNERAAKSNRADASERKWSVGVDHDPAHWGHRGQQHQKDRHGAAKGAAIGGFANGGMVRQGCRDWGCRRHCQERRESASAKAGEKKSSFHL